MDAAAIRSRKAARALVKKYSKLDAKRLVAPDPPKRRRPFKARKPTASLPIASLPTTSLPTTLLPTTLLPTTSLPTTSLPTEYSWATEQAWLELAPPKELPLSSGQSESTQAQSMEQKLPLVPTNLTDDDLNTLHGKACHDLVFFPIHDQGNHWTLIVVNMPRWFISYYESMGGNGDHHLQTIHDFLRAECAEKHPTRPFVPFTCVNERRLPQQHNTRDCEVFMCQNAEHIARGAPLTFTQADMPRFRLQMERELMEGRLLL
uniref:Ubiquitin-like protease family profile domain-containing protein n=1 Tax=Plectus sambesii TaxID=2011161 RepID=A0A914WK68_9BILA